MPLTREQLLLPEKELEQLETALANSEVVEPFTTAAAEAAAQVTRYTSAYTLADADRSRLERPLVIYQLYSLVGSVSAAIQKAYDAAIAELKDIRDGKFPGLETSDGGTTSTGGWGSKTKINFPGDE
jgi:hypothetical protein